MDTIKVQQGMTVDGLAKKYGVTRDMITSVNNLSDPNMIKIGQDLQIPKTIPQDVIKTPVPNLIIPTQQSVPAPKVNTQPFINDANSFIQSLQSPVSEPETTRNDLMDNLKVLLGETRGKEAKRNSLYTSTGINDLVGKINDYTSQITALDNTNTAEQLSVGQAVGGITASEQQREQSRIDRQNAIKKLGISSSLAAVQGKYQTAKTLADQAIEAEFAPKEAMVKNIKDFLDINKYDLERADKKAYDKQNFMIQERSRLLAEEKDTKKEISSLALEARKNGAGDEIITRISSAKTPLDAIRAMGQYANDPIDRAIKQAQLNKIRSSIQSSSGGGGVTSGGNNEIKTNALTAAYELKTAIDKPGNLLSNALNKLGIVGQVVKAGIPNQLLGESGFKGSIGTKSASSFFGIKDNPISGTPEADFVNTFDNLKGLLSLENIKYLKGQGAISDGERKTLEQASSRLNRNISEDEFKKILNTTITTLGGSPEQDFSLSEDDYVNALTGEGDSSPFSSFSN